MYRNSQGVCRRDGKNSSGTKRTWNWIICWPIRHPAEQYFVCPVSSSPLNHCLKCAHLWPSISCTEVYPVEVLPCDVSLLKAQYFVTLCLIVSCLLFADRHILVMRGSRDNGLSLMRTWLSRDQYVIRTIWSVIGNSRVVIVVASSVTVRHSSWRSNDSFWNRALI